MNLAQLLDQCPHQLKKIVSLGLDAQNHFELAGCNQQGRSSDEPRNDRMAQEACQKAQTQQAHDKQHGARQECQSDGHAPVRGRTNNRKIPNGRGRHERHHGHGPHGQHSAGAKNRVQQQGRYAGVQTHLGRQTRQRGIRQALGDEHDGHDQRGHQVADQRLAIVVAGPIQHGKKSA